MFVTATISGQYVDKFLFWHKKFGPVQNILGPVKGRGIKTWFYKKSGKNKDPLPYLFVFLLCKVYVVNCLWGYSPFQLPRRQSSRTALYFSTQNLFIMLTKLEAFPVKT